MLRMCEAPGVPPKVIAFTPSTGININYAAADAVAFAVIALM